MNLQDTIAFVQGAYPSLFTKEDVITLLERITIPVPEPIKVTMLTEEQVEDLIDQVADALSGEDIFDAEDVDYDISINDGYSDNKFKVDVDINSIATDDHKIEKIVRDTVIEWFEKNTQSESDEPNNLNPIQQPTVEGSNQDH